MMDTKKKKKKWLRNSVLKKMKVFGKKTLIILVLGDDYFQKSVSICFLKSIGR